MKVYWEYSCHERHSWVIFREEDAAECAEDTICPFGHKALLLNKQRPVNSIEISIRPAIRIMDPFSKQEGYKNEYCVVLSDTHETFAKVSQKVYTWEECIEIANKFKGMNIKMSLVRWKKMNP